MPTRTVRRKWTMKYKKSINCKKPRGFSQKQHCKYGRTKKRVKKTLKGGVGENMAMNVTRKFGTVLTKVATGIGRGAVDVGTGVADDLIRRQGLKQEISNKADFHKYNPANPGISAYYDDAENKENNINIGNQNRGVINSKFPNLSPKYSSPQISAPPKIDFSDF